MCPELRGCLSSPRGTGIKGNLPASSLSLGDWLVNLLALVWVLTWGFIVEPGLALNLWCPPASAGLDHRCVPPRPSCTLITFRFKNQ